MSNFEDDERFDGLYLNVANTTRGIEPLLDSVFSFLRRKTDFFAGPPGSEDGTAAAIAKVNEVLQKHAKKYQADNNNNNNNNAPKVVAKKAASPKKKKADKKEEEEVIEMGRDGQFDISGAEAATTTTTDKTPQSTPTPTASTTTPAAAAADTPKAEEPAKKSDESDESDKPAVDKPPVGNGGTVEGKYVWTQLLSEVTVTIPVPNNTRGRDLNVTISRTHLKVGYKAVAHQKIYIINAPLCKPVICDDSFWTVEDGNRLVIQLQKSNQIEWWNCVCQGEPTIDVTKIQPESSNLGDLDGETRKTVEKMMFDQRQKAMGLPTSEEQTKLDALERFKKQHPEMDFSNAKIS